MWSVGYTPSDLSSFSSRIARYLVTAQRRREDELEELSTYDYLVGMNSATNAPDYSYSDAFHEQIIKMPRILAAFDARWGDARTNLNVFIQLNMSLDRYDSKADGVLDGPTTYSWFDPCAGSASSFDRGRCVASGSRPLPARVRRCTPSSSWVIRRLSPTTIVFRGT
jgi:hypothetical protein